MCPLPDVPFFSPKGLYATGSRAEEKAMVLLQSWYISRFISPNPLSIGKERDPQWFGQESTRKSIVRPSKVEERWGLHSLKIRALLRTPWRKEQSLVGWFCLFRLMSHLFLKSQSTKKPFAGSFSPKKVLFNLHSSTLAVSQGSVYYESNFALDSVGGIFVIWGQSCHEGSPLQEKELVRIHPQFSL